MTPYSPTPQPLLYMQGVNVLSLKTFGKSNVLYTYIFFETTLRITVMWDDAQVP